jgi:hypothetical protein
MACFDPSASTVLWVVALREEHARSDQQAPTILDLWVEVLSLPSKDRTVLVQGEFYLLLWFAVILTLMAPVFWIGSRLSADG